MKSDAVDSRDFYGPTDLADQAAKILLKLVVRGENILCFAVKDLSGRRQCYLASTAHAFEKSSFEFLFQRTDLLTHGGLRDEIALGREGKTLQVYKVTENFEGLDMHFFSFPSALAQYQLPRRLALG